MDRPKLVVIMGANGAGKTTWGGHHRDRLPLHFYNGDIIAEGLGDANSAELQAPTRALVAGEIAERLRAEDLFGLSSSPGAIGHRAPVRPDVPETGLRF